MTNQVTFQLPQSTRSEISSQASTQSRQNQGQQGIAASNQSTVNIQQAEPTNTGRTGAFLFGAVVGMRGAVRGFVLAPSAFVVQTALGTANVLLEGVTDALFQVAKKGGLQEISDGNTQLSTLLQHNIEHERSEIAENKPYAQYLANDATVDFQQAKALFNRTNEPVDFEIKAINVGKNDAGENTGIIQLDETAKNNFSSHQRDNDFQIGTIKSREASQYRALHFLKHSGLATVDLIRATTRAAFAIGIGGIQIGKALGIGLASSIVDISFTVLKKGGLQELLKRESNIGAILRHNFERHFQQIADKPYALILGYDAMSDLYSLITNLKSSVAWAPAPTNRAIPEQEDIGGPEQDTHNQEIQWNPSSSHSSTNISDIPAISITPASNETQNETHHTTPRQNITPQEQQSTGSRDIHFVPPYPTMNEGAQQRLRSILNSSTSFVNDNSDSSTSLSRSERNFESSENYHQSTTTLNIDSNQDRQGNPSSHSSASNSSYDSFAGDSINSNESEDKWSAKNIVEKYLGSADNSHITQTVSNTEADKKQNLFYI